MIFFVKYGDFEERSDQLESLAEEQLLPTRVSMFTFQFDSPLFWFQPLKLFIVLYLISVDCTFEF